MFEMRKDVKQLIEKKVEIFHLLVAKLWFIMKGFEPDLDTAMIFFTTILSKINVDDWGKLRSIHRFVNCIFKEKYLLARQI